MSLGAQSFQPELLRVLERVAGPDDVRRAVHHLRDAGFDNISLDLIYGIPGQSAADLEADLDDALALEPEHLSCYELEAKPGTRFTHAWGEELARQADAMEDYFERVVATLTGAGYRWYETANFCRAGRTVGATCARGTTSATGSATTTSVSGSARCRQSRTALAEHAADRALLEALARGGSERELEPLDDGRARARARHARAPARRAAAARRPRHALDAAGLARVEQLGLAGATAARRSTLTERGRFLGGAVTAELLA